MGVNKKFLDTNLKHKSKTVEDTLQLVDFDEKKLDNIISNFELKGAVNILIKNEKITLKSGSSADKIFGTFDYPKSNGSDKVRCNFTNLILVYENGTINLRIVYKKEDKYGSMIEEKIINSMELIKEL